MKGVQQIEILYNNKWKFEIFIGDRNLINYKNYENLCTIIVIKYNRKYYKLINNIEYFFVYTNGW